MKYIYKTFGKLSLAFYIFTLYQVWHLCQFRGLRSHMPIIILSIVCCAFTFILWIIARTRETQSEQPLTTNKTLFYIELFIFIVFSIFFGAKIIQTAIPYHGALSWKIDEWLRKKEIRLEHNNIFESGVEGILEDIVKKLDLPDNLYIANKCQISFDKKGTIHELYAFLYGKNEEGEKKTYLISYNTKNSKKMSVWVDGHTNGEYEPEMKLLPMLRILANTSWKNQVRDWSVSQSRGQIYELLYYGKRSFKTQEGLRYIPGDADGDGIDNGTSQFSSLDAGGAIIGYEVSLHIPADSEITPIRYIMEPQYVSSEQIFQESVKDEIADAKEEKKWTYNQSDGNMYFFLDYFTGWRLAVIDAATGSRFYVLEKSTNGGSTWERINEDPFDGKWGVAEGLIFYDNNYGIAGVANGSQSNSEIFITRDGGITFSKVELPMEDVTGLPEIAYEFNFTIDDYAYLSMPVIDNDVMSIIVTTGAAEKDGLVFLSYDQGNTWEYIE